MRKDWDSYFMSICDLVSQRSTCDKRNVGSVIVRDNIILSTGYNGSISGLEHCSSPSRYFICSSCKKENDASHTRVFVRCTYCDYEFKQLENVILYEGGHIIDDTGSCIRTVHAETNAIAHAAKFGISINKSILYTTDSPCWNCFKTIVSSGIREVVYKRLYKKSFDRVTEFANKIYYKDDNTCFILRRYEG
jgi:dCMP deaminase